MLVRVLVVVEAVVEVVEEDDEEKRWTFILSITLGSIAVSDGTVTLLLFCLRAIFPDLARIFDAIMLMIKISLEPEFRRECKMVR